MVEKLETIIFRVALIVAIIVIGLSFYHSFSLLAIILKGGVSFLLIYLLGYALILLWQKVSPEPDFPKMDAKEDDSQQDAKQTKAHDSRLAGQINMEKLNNLADAKNQAETIKKMVQGDTK